MTTEESGTTLDTGDNSPNSPGDVDGTYYGAKKTHVLVKPNEV